MARRFALVVIAAILAFATGIIAGAAPETRPRAHMSIASPATLSGERAEMVYRAIRAAMRRQYMESEDPVTAAYQGWERYNTVPYRSSLHGNLFVNNYANPRASNYAEFEKLGTLPVGAVIAKDSFTVTEGGDVMTGPIFLMEKREAGFNPAAGDWLFMMIRPDGSVAGTTGGPGAENVTFCGDCHGSAPAGQDNLFFMPERVRRPR